MQRDSGQDLCHVVTAAQCAAAHAAVIEVARLQSTLRRSAARVARDVTAVLCGLRPGCLVDYAAVSIEQWHEVLQAARSTSGPAGAVLIGAELDGTLYCLHAQLLLQQLSALAALQPEQPLPSQKVHQKHQLSTANGGLGAPGNPKLILLGDSGNRSPDSGLCSPRLAVTKEFQEVSGALQRLKAPLQQAFESQQHHDGRGCNRPLDKCNDAASTLTPAALPPEADASQVSSTAQTSDGWQVVNSRHRGKGHGNRNSNGNGPNCPPSSTRRPCRQDSGVSPCPGAPVTATAPAPATAPATLPAGGVGAVAEHHSGGMVSTVLRLGATPGLPLLPTLNGWLLGYPVAYLVPSNPSWTSPNDQGWYID
mmetsp:Transcript_14647/g.44256  ORF Transcript_14647/g.44256 Transcript_14647/m.44256 type:complete len:366 (-) Transcript_14647:436-1533(-)